MSTEQNEICTRPFKFEKEDGAKLITLEDLKETRMLKDAKKELPKSRPFTHAQILDKLISAMDNMNIEHEEPEIYVAWNKSHFDDRLETFINAPDALGCWFFDRIVARIGMPGSNGFKPGIALGYNERGVSLAFGTNVNVCKNFCIFGDKHATTYGNLKMPFEKAFELIMFWLQNRAELFQKDSQILHAMMEINIDKGGRNENELIGRMQRIATQQYVDSEIKSPFTQTQVNELTKMIILGNYTGAPEDIHERDYYSLYELYMMCTQLITHSITNLEDKWERIAMLGSFIQNQYLPVPA